MFRYKSMLAVKGLEEKVLFQGVHNRLSGGSSVHAWKKDEKRECSVVFIGRDLDKMMLTPPGGREDLGRPLEHQAPPNAPCQSGSE